MTPHVYVSCDLRDGESLKDYHRRTHPPRASFWARLWARLKG